MCLGSIDVLAEVFAADPGSGRLGCGKVVSLAFVPEARAGDHVLVHLGIPVEVLDPAAAEDAMELRATGEGGSR